MELNPVYILIIIFICLIAIVNSTSWRKEEYVTPHPSPRILIAVIAPGKTANPRWNAEQQNWISHFKPKSNIEVELLECNSSTESFTPVMQVVQYDCTESFKPGIFQKSVLCMKANIDRFDFFIRTNLSTFVVQSRLQSYIRLKKNYLTENIYTGCYCDRNQPWWVGGWGILMNANACKLLLQDSFKPQHFNNNTRPDDVLIGDILKSKNVTCQTSEQLSYRWNSSISNEANFRNIHTNPSAIFIRLKNITHYHLITKALYQIYG
mgnify:CR=1 FL=1